MQNAEAYGQALRLTETPMETNDSFTAETVTFWRQHAGRELTHEEARQAAVNVAAFFKTLDQWDRAIGEAAHRAEEGR